MPILTLSDLCQNTNNQLKWIKRVIIHENIQNRRNCKPPVALENKYTVRSKTGPSQLTTCKKVPFCQVRFVRDYDRNIRYTVYEIPFIINLTIPNISEINGLRMNSRAFFKNSKIDKYIWMYLIFEKRSRTHPFHSRSMKTSQKFFSDILW